MVRIRVLPYFAEFTVEGPARLVDVLDDHGGRGLPLSCRGATCAICRVQVRRGQELLEPAAARELETLRGAGAAADERLACQIDLRPDVHGELELALSSTSASVGS
jgi:ferredoxin